MANGEKLYNTSPHPGRLMVQATVEKKMRKIPSQEIDDLLKKGNANIIVQVVIDNKENIPD